MQQKVTSLRAYHTYNEKKLTPPDYLLMLSAINVKQKLIFMEQTIYTTLKRWESSIMNFGKVDQWNINEDYTVIGTFITTSKSLEAKNAVRDCRDYSLRLGADIDILLEKVQNANRILNKTNDSRINKEMKKKSSTGQSKRFASTTKRLYSERLRFMDGEYLKDVDITIEDGPTSRKVRRIVEKRMCQAYHRQHKGLENEGGRDRHYMKRATSFQLHNLGQIECGSGFSRSESTHWKKVYDPIEGGYVFKKKMEYSSFEEADQAAKEFMRRHPEDAKLVSAYKCAHCGKWHIGHTTPEEEKSYPEMNTYTEMAS